METNYFLGIDLGTTNSVIAYANPQPDGSLKPMVLEIPRLSDTGGSRSEKTLPSVVYYKHDRNGQFEPIVGDFAKAQYGKRYGFVIKSVKSSMGENEIPDINQDVPDQKPADVSAKILQQLIAGAKKKLILPDMPRDVVITIPASFDGDQCKATLDAAAEAGIYAYNQDGNPKDMLLYEPKAVLYDIINSQMNGEIPQSIMDLTTPKHILVYDLGGGTLDVSLYKVSKSEHDELLNIEDIAISRYTRLGGDNFDYLIAQNLCDEFIDMYKDYFTITEQARKEIMAVFIKKAELLKIDMNNDFEMLATRNEVLPDDHTVYMSELNLYNGYAFERDLSKKEMVDFIRPLMGEHLSLGDIDCIDRLTSNIDVNNIIYPILDVLAKAKAKHGDTTVDYVILNGGMSKFFPVIERIRQFFGKEPITLNDPDMSVAKGAAIYHYYLHKYKIASHIESFVPIAKTQQVKLNTDENNSSDEEDNLAPGTLLLAKPDNYVEENFFNKRILNDTLNLEVSGGSVIPIAQAGTSLPFVSKDLEILVLPKDGKSIRLPLYYGSGKRAELPNRKIAERVLTFPKTYAADTPISLQVNINQLNIISIRTWVTNKNEELGSVSMAVGKSLNKLSLGKIYKKTKKKTAKNPSASVNTVADYHSLCEQLYVSCQLFQKALKQKVSPATKDKLVRQIKRIRQRMKTAPNKDLAGIEINMAIEAYQENGLFFSHILGIGAKLAPGWDEWSKQVFRKKCRQLIETVLINKPIYVVRDYHMQAINGLASIKDPNDIPLMNSLLLLEDKSFPNCAAIALGKLKADPTTLINQTLNLTSMDTSKLDSHWWAIGKLCSRELNIYHDFNLLDIVVGKCIELIMDKRIKNPSIINSLVYALGELCDRRAVVAEPLYCEPNRKAKQALSVLERNITYTRLETLCINKINLARKMINGVSLTVTDGAQLLALRENR